MRELATWVKGRQADGRLIVLVRALDVAGFGAGQYDNALVLADDGAKSGVVLRGLADDLIVEAAGPVVSDGVGRVIRVKATTPEAEQVGLSCGGTAALIVQPVSSLPSEFWNAAEAGRSMVLATRVDADDRLAPGSLVILDDGASAGSIDGDTDAIAVEHGGELLANDRRSRLRVELDGGSALHLDKIVPRTRVMMVGSGELAEALTDVTRSLGWLIDVVPDDDAAIGLVRSLGPSDALVVTSHHPERGPATLWSAMASEAGYLGALGSRHTQTARAEQLAVLGATQTQIDTIHGPVGLDLGGRSPAETALAICAEILAVRSGKSVPGLRDTSGSINS